MAAQLLTKRQQLPQGRAGLFAEFGRQFWIGKLHGDEPAQQIREVIQKVSGATAQYRAGVDKVERGIPGRESQPARVFHFEGIQEAHRLMESNQAKGKIVVVV